MRKCRRGIKGGGEERGTSKLDCMQAQRVLHFSASVTIVL